MLTTSEMFAFENRHPRHTSAKEERIFEEMGVRPARYYQLLRHAAMTAEGWELDPMLCRRVLEREAA